MPERERPPPAAGPPGPDGAAGPGAAPAGADLPLRLADPESLPGLILSATGTARADLADPGLTERLATRLEGVTPFARLPAHDALRLLWSVLPAGSDAPAADRAASRPEAREAYLTALARLAHPGGDPDPRRALETAVRAILEAEPDALRRRLAARTALARLRYAGAATPAGRALAEAALRRAVPGLDPSPAGAAEVLISRAAGLVLFAPYLRTLFGRAEVLAPDGSLAAGRRDAAAAHLRALSRLEAPGLDPLERVFLGLAPGETAAPGPADARLLALTEGLTQAVIERWGALGRTSAEGLREAFVRREGELEFEPDGTARLRVLPGPFDVLVDRLPWSVTPIRAPWMPAALHVRWRDGDD